MKTGYSIILASFLLVSCIDIVNANSTKGIAFFRGSWQEALVKAKAENKPIFVDFYADWCGPCKRMAKEVFTDAEVGAWFNENIISFQINAEKQEADLVGKMSLEAYPTLVIFDPQGNVISRLEGGLDKTQLINFAKYASSYDYLLAQYRADCFNFEKINALLIAQQGRDKSKLDSMATAILNGLPFDKMKTAEAWTLLITYSGDYNSKAFDFITKNAGWYYRNIDIKDTFQEGYSWFIEAMLNNAIEKSDKKLVEKARRDFINMRKACGTLNRPEAYFTETFHLRYALLSGDTTYHQKLLAFTTRWRQNDWRSLAANALEILQSAPIEGPIRTSSIRLAERAFALSNNPFTNFTLATARSLAGRQEEAKALTLAALQKCKSDKITFGEDGMLSINFEEIKEKAVLTPLAVK